MGGFWAHREGYLFIPTDNQEDARKIGPLPNLDTFGEELSPKHIPFSGPRFADSLYESPKPMEESVFSTSAASPLFVSETFPSKPIAPSSPSSWYSGTHLHRTETVSGSGRGRYLRPEEQLLPPEAYLRDISEDLVEEIARWMEGVPRPKADGFGLGLPSKEKRRGSQPHEWLHEVIKQKK